MGPPRWVERYLGIPGIPEGNTAKGCHCFGLMQLVFAQERGIRLASFNGITAEQGQAAVDAINASLATAAWTEVEDMASFDGVVMFTPHKKYGMLPAHIGIAAGSRYVLHVRPGGVSICEPLDSLRPQVAGIYRYQRA